MRQPYCAPKNAPVVAYHRGHIVRKPAPNTSSPTGRANQNFDKKEYQNERKWDRGRSIVLARRLDMPAVFDHRVCAWEVRGCWVPPSRHAQCYPSMPTLSRAPWRLAERFRLRPGGDAAAEQER